MGKTQILTKTDYKILALFLVASMVFSLVFWLLPFDTTNLVIPAIPVICAVTLYLIIRRHDRMIDFQARQNDYRQIESWVALQAFFKPDLPISGLREGALSPDLAVLLCRELLSHKPELMIECGAGISTIINGYLLKRSGKGKLITLEHDHIWAQKVNSWIILHDLTDHVEVLHSPLIEQEIKDQKFYWYDIEVLQNILNSNTYKGIDILFVDGPPEFINADIRRPAVPVLQKWFNQNCIVIVDDTNRPAETQIVQEWCNILETTAEMLLTEKGAAIIRST